MNEDAILNKYLDKAAKDAEKEIIETGKITVENAIPIILISQINHLGTIEKKVGIIEEEIKDIKVNVATMQDNMATMQTDMATMQTNMATMQTNMATMQTNMATMQTNMATKDDIANMVTKRELSEFKSDLKHWMMFGIAILALLGTVVAPFLSLFITRLLGQ